MIVTICGDSVASLLTTEVLYNVSKDPVDA
jgi:hypothetical protein